MKLNAKPLNKKSKDSIKNCSFLSVWEGAVRSGKTVVSLIAWIIYIVVSKEHVFLMSGNTLGSISRNCIDGDFGFIALTFGLAKKRTDTDGSKYLEFLGNKIYYCGADNKASFKKIRGLTLGGWYADEINLHDKEFLAEAMRRTLASSDRKHFWTLNPEAPGHWIYKDYIDKYQEDNVDGFRWYHFTLDDNPAITEQRKQEIKKQYTGFFYQRYILGRRVRAEGACYPSFKQSHILKTLPDEIKKSIRLSTIGSDIGGNGSATAYCCSGAFVDKKSGELCFILLDEDYIDMTNDGSNVKDTQYILDRFKTFAERASKEYGAVDCYTDSAEQLIKRSMSNLAVVNVMNSKKTPIVDRIRFFDLLMAQDRFYIMSHCKHTIEAIEGAVWDDKSNKDVRLDNGTSNIDSLDAMEYSIERYMKDFL